MNGLQVCTAMARYFFDCFDGVSFHQDTDGMELIGIEEVADQAAGLARMLMLEQTSVYGAHAVTVQVRSTDGAQIYAAHLSFHGLVAKETSPAKF